MKERKLFGENVFHDFKANLEIPDRFPVPFIRELLSFVIIDSTGVQQIIMRGRGREGEREREFGEQQKVISSGHS